MSRTSSAYLGAHGEGPPLSLLFKIDNLILIQDGDVNNFSSSSCQFFYEGDGVLSQIVTIQYKTAQIDQFETEPIFIGDTILLQEACGNE